MEALAKWLMKPLLMGVLVTCGQRWESLEGKQRGDEDDPAVCKSCSVSGKDQTEEVFIVF